MSRSAVSRTDLLWALQLSADCQALVLPEVEQLALAFQRQQRQAEPEGKGGIDGGGLPPRAQTSHRLPLRMPTGWYGDMVLHHDEGPGDDEGLDLPSSPVPELQRPSREAAQALQRRVDAPESAHLARARLRASICHVLPWQGSVDWSQLVRQLAQGEWLAQLPRRRAPRWPAQLHVLVDSESPSVASFRHDIEAMLASLKRAMGATGLVVHRVGPALTELQGPRSLGRASMGQKWLVLGDGRVGEIEKRFDALGTPDIFAAWVKRMMRAQNQVHLIGPLSNRALPELPMGMVGRSWSSSRAVLGQARRGTWFDMAPPDAYVVEALVLMLGQVSSLLLRALCQLATARPLAAAVEWAVWNSPAMERCGSYLTPTHGAMGSAIVRYLLTSLPRSLLEDARRLQQIFQHGVSDADLHLTTLRIAEAAPQMAESLAAEVQAAKLFLHQVATQMEPAGPGAARLLEAAKAARMVNKAPPSLRAAHRGLFRQVASRAYRDNLERGEDIPQWEELGILLPERAQDMGETDGEKQLWSLQIDAAGIRLQQAADVGAEPVQARVIAPLLGPVSPAHGLSLLESGRSRWIGPLQAGMVCHALGPEAETLELDFGRQSVQVQRVQRPHWAASFAQTSQGLRALIHLPCGAEYWLNPSQHEGALQHSLTQDFRLDMDRFGPRLWCDHVALRPNSAGASDLAFRYMPPATFLMGSPEEGGEEDEHPQHSVTIGQGFWLAETPCTQNLWLEFMDENPSHFIHGQESFRLPVENVSWDEVHLFLAQLNSVLPDGWEAVLPSEVQWEYASRAGTSSTFWWGDAPDENRANFDVHGTKQLSDPVGTSAVDRYLPSPWGLHDMHGNVWEWCSDGRQVDEPVASLDPDGTTEANLRAVRGGSWFLGPDRATSACRDWRFRNVGGHFQGFRVALVPGKRRREASLPEVPIDRHEGEAGVRGKASAPLSEQTKPRGFS
ncbi:formylglycine-generating enzyme family protein [Paucibacter sp. DJ1R-11]|uniref:formylglycine-generating enzyme family protein n=1 Tax=Paucibacter sp. DJ1R-11 TaxID=2893556 RepID=UPI0021E45A80|nr:formylglycine-generating enzyme family protein [Paucibacter sp. DJ1R-11]MCV2362179.1 formylglycine-generating enzyme family protein [Paucibacter sp. DJ1R-11]